MFRERERDDVRTLPKKLSLPTSHIISDVLKHVTRRPAQGHRSVLFGSVLFCSGLFGSAPTLVTHSNAQILFLLYRELDDENNLY